MSKNYKSVFDIIGPVMVGPSSSHTAGAVRIGQMARAIFNGTPEKIHIYLYESFAKTYRGHGTDIALVGGLLGMETADPRLHDSLALAQNSGLKVVFIPLLEERSDHPNTARIVLHGAHKSVSVVGVSLGGGKAKIIKIDTIDVDIGDDVPTIIIRHQDVPGVIYEVTRQLTQFNINIASMKVNRTKRGLDAIMLIEYDDNGSGSLFENLISLNNINDVMIVNS